MIKIMKKYIIMLMLLSVSTINTIPVSAEDEVSSSNELQQSSQLLSEISTSSSEQTFETTESQEVNESTEPTQDEIMSFEDYYENVPSSRSDLNPPAVSRAKRETRATIDRVNAGEANRPTVSFIDVSSHNATITVDQYRMMKGYGIKGVVVKLTEATTYLNPFAQSQIQNALAAGLKVSAYHYSHYTSTASAQAEARYFASKAQLLNLPKETVMVSDIEESKMSNSSLNANTKAFKEMLNSLGYNNVAYYLSRSWLSEAGGVFNVNQFGKNNIWVAQYPYTPTASQNWNNDYSSWQWSSDFYFPGIAHPFDINTDYTGLFTGNGWDGSVNVTGKTTIKDIDGKENMMNLSATVDSGRFIPYKVYFAVWSDKNGQDDLIWYEGKRDSNGFWSTNVNIANHATDGTYIVHTYAQMSTNSSSKIMLNNSNFTISSPSLSASIGQYSNGGFDVIVNPITKSGVKKVQVPSWSKSDQSDIKWYDATLQSDGTYKARVKISNHNYNQGIYRVHAYLYTNNNLSSARSVGTVEVKLKGTSGTIMIDDIDGKDITFKANSTISMGEYAEPTALQHAVWSDENGQDDIVWYTAKKTGAGSYTAEFDIRKHKSAGNYSVHTYAKLPNGTMKAISQDSFVVTKPSFEASIGKVDISKGTFDVIINPSSKSGVDKIQVPIWSVANQSDIKWYDASLQSNGTYKTTAKISNHNFNDGIYRVHVYLYGKNGLRTASSIGTTEVKLDGITGETSIQNIDGKEINFEAKTKFTMGAFGTPAAVYFATWSNEYGQDDIVWYNGKRNTDGSYSTKVNVNKHKSVGPYTVHTYVKLVNGRMKMISNDSFTVTEPVLKVSTQNVNKSKGTFDVVMEVDTVSGVDKLEVPVWTDKNQKDIKWYPAIKQSNGTYKVTVNKKDHQNSTSNYTAHVYLYSKNGLVTRRNGNAEKVSF